MITSRPYHINARRGPPCCLYPWPLHWKPMKARVLLFARLRELAGTAQVEVEVGEGLPAQEVYRRVQEMFPALASCEIPVAFAVNARYVGPQHPVGEGDEVAIIPPVAGGG